MLKEKIEKENGVAVIDNSDDTTISSLSATPLDEGRVRLIWHWPKMKEYNCAFVVEINRGEPADINSIINAINQGENVVENVATKSEFNFHFDILPTSRVCRFAVFPYKLENGKVIIPKQNEKNNVSDEIIRKINVQYQLSRVPLNKSIGAGVFSTVKSFLTQGDNTGMRKFFNYEKVIIKIDNFADVKKNEDFIYYDVKINEEKTRRYCVDLDIFEEKADIVFYVKKGNEISLVSGDNQNINYNKVN